LDSFHIEEAMRIGIGLVLLSAGLAVGCRAGVLGFETVRGSGVIKEETRSVGDFSAVDIGQAIKATITVGPETSVQIEGDDNILPLIKTEVRDGKLATSVAGGVSIAPTKVIVMTISTPKLTAIAGEGASDITATLKPTDTLKVEASGASRMQLTGIASDKLDVDASGASHVTMTGESKDLTVEMSGASHLDANKLAAQSVQVSGSGASRGEVQSAASIKGDLSGATSLRVMGKPEKRSVSTSGASSVSYQ
jgi:hypothetical protein